MSLTSDKFVWQPDDIKIIRKDKPTFTTGKKAIDELPTKAVDLGKWEAKALKSFKRFHKADVSFETNAISLPEQVAIHDALKAADSTEAIKAAFRGVDALMQAVDADARRWVEEAGVDAT